MTRTSDVNNISLTGEVVSEPSFQRGKSGCPFVIFTLSCIRPFKNDKNEVDLINVAHFGPNVPNVQKGDVVYVTGYLNVKNGTPQVNSKFMALLGDFDDEGY